MTIEKTVSFDFIMDTYVSVKAPEGTDPETLIKQAKELFIDRLNTGEADVIFDSIFEE